MRGRAIRIRDGVLVLDQHSVDPPGAGQLLVSVAAAGLNRADILQRRGLYPAPPGVPADIPGLEYAGTVRAVGPGVIGWSAGERVMGIVGGGAMATEIVVSAAEAIRVPAGTDLVRAAAIPEVFVTAFDALFEQGQLARGEIVLVHSIGSGVGTAALQLARVYGHDVVGTSRTRDKLDRAVALGLTTPVFVERGEFASAVHAACPAGVDVIIDTVGAAYFEQNLAALALRGRLVIIGLLGGQKATLPLGTLLTKRARVIGTVLRSRAPSEKAALATRFSEEVLPRFASGELAPVIDAILPMARVAEAHQRMERDETFGKIVLAWD